MTSLTLKKLAICNGRLEGAERLRPPPLGRQTDAVTHGHVS